MGKARFPLEVACNITASEVTRNSGDLSVPGRHDPSAPDYQRTIPSSLGKAASGLVPLPEGRKGAGAPFPISPGKTTSSNFRCEVPAWVPDLKKKGGGAGEACSLHLKNKQTNKKLKIKKKENSCITSQVSACSGKI